jgi:geranylgeranyl diphosphate synthase type I
MVVVGDTGSANSRELFAACKAVNENTFFSEGVGDLIDKNLPEGDIGLVGSASTPTEAVDQVRDVLEFKAFLEEAKKEIEEAGDAFFAELEEEVKGEFFIPEAVAELKAQHAGGKRLRGALVKLGSMLSYGYAPTKVALAYEIFQTAILIHDDIIDRAAMRRGRPTISADGTHRAISRAICIGDYGLFLANKLLAEARLEKYTYKRVQSCFINTQITTLQGEMMDIELPFADLPPDKREAVVDTISIYKTAFYTMMGPLVLGATCVNADTELMGDLAKLGMMLGSAFQIRDDIMGIFADEEATGKPSLSDIREGKQTLLYTHALRNGTDLEGLYGKEDADEADLARIREIFTESGALADSEESIASLTSIALDIIGYMECPHTSLLRGLAHYLQARKV